MEGGDKNKLESLAEDFFRQRQERLQPERKCPNDNEKPNEGAAEEVSAQDLDLDNDDVGVEAWKDMLGIAEEGDGEEGDGEEDEFEIVEAEKESEEKGDDTDLEEGEIRSEGEEEEEEEVQEVKEPTRKMFPSVPSRPRSPKTAEQIRDKIYRKMAGRKKTTSAAVTGGRGKKAQGTPAPEVKSKDRAKPVASIHPK